MSDYEGQVVFHVFGRRWRFYLGHTLKPWVRARRWRSDLSQGMYVVPWGSRVLGMQWRRSEDRVASGCGNTPQ